jgi:hypothetical protein
MTRPYVEQSWAGAGRFGIGQIEARPYVGHSAGSLRGGKTYIALRLLSAQRGLHVCLSLGQRLGDGLVAEEDAF